MATFNGVPMVAGGTASAVRPPQADIEQFRQLLAAIDSMTATGGRGDDLFSDLAGLVKSARGEEAATRGAYTDALRRGAPETSPLADLVARSLGTAAAGLTGSESPRQLAESTIHEQQARLTANHAQELESLAAAYNRAADRAARLGDTEMEVKLREKVARNREQQAEKLNVLKLLMQSRLQERSLAAQSSREAGRESSMATRAERVALIGQGINPDTGKPLPFGGGHSPLRTNAGASGFVTEAQAQTNFNKLLSLAKEKGAFGATYREKRILNYVMDNYRPSVRFAADPQGFIDHLLTLYTPDGKPIIPRDPKNPAQIRADILPRFQAMIKSYWPNEQP